ncbi:MAG: phospholipid carrier-dependent glycosyltransferase, partial [Rikenellaceae bacterium]|nr:phospholipid carrier-dependent glycosyltransferase [Rikenellaceae bacterium]
INHNVRPIYYYWQFPAEAGIWALFFITAILSYFSFKTLTYRKEYRFSLLWLLTALILLSLIPEKKTRYLLPILIPGSLVMGFYFYNLFKNHMASRDQWIFRINALVIALVLASIPMALYLIFYREEQISLFLLVLSGIISWSLCFWILRSIWNPKGIRVVSVFLAVIAAMIMVETICLIPFGKLFINEERHSIRALRDHKAVEGLPLYYHAAEELRMELVYESNKTIRPLHIDQDTLVLDRTPFVFVSGISVDSLFAGKNVTIEHIDTFDNNWRKTGHKRYNPNLVRHVAIIRKHPELSDSPVFPQP